MMKNVVYYFFAALALSFTACQKDSDPVNPSNVGSRIKTETYQGGVDTYSYDERGRVIYAIYADSAHDVTQYYNGYFIEKEYDAQGNLQNQKHFELNADSLVESLTTTAQPDLETWYAYDDQKRLIESTSTSPGDLFVVNYFYGPEGNQDSVVVQRNGVWQYTYSYTYLEHQPNVYNKKTYGRIYFGEESKNLVAGAYWRFSNPNNNDILQFDYTFDSQGRVISMTERFNGISDQYDYTY